MATLMQASLFGYEAPKMHSKDLAIGRWGKVWVLLDMTGDAPAQLGIPNGVRYLVMEEAERRIRNGDYQ